MNIKRTVKISRPRFWMYLLGTYLVGIVASGDILLHSKQVFIILGLFFLFFTFPANIFIYGVNDIFDYETDRLNPKKIKYEELVTPKDRRALIKTISVSLLPFLFLIPFLNKRVIIAFFVFLFAGLFYSAKPIRAKSKPFLDIIFSSAIYISPAVLGFLATGNPNVSWLGVFGGLLWASAMQTYSAVPDIESDKKAGLSTLATFLGKKMSLYFCFVLYLAAGAIAYTYIGPFSIIITTIYAGIIILSLFYKKSIFSIYKAFPFVNSFLGFILFLLLALKAVV